MKGVCSSVLNTTQFRCFIINFSHTHAQKKHASDSQKLETKRGNRHAAFFFCSPHHLCKRPCFPGEFSVTSAPCRRAICPQASRTASPSAGPAAASWNSGSLCGREYCCELWRTHMDTVSTACSLSPPDPWTKKQHRVSGGRGLSQKLKVVALKFVF